MLPSFTIKTKLLGGFGLIVAALVGVAWLSGSGIGTVRDLLVDYRGAARQSLAVNAAAAAMVETRMSFFKYRVAFDPAILQAVHASLDESIENANKLKDQLAGTADAAAVDALIAASQDYDRGVDGFVAAHEKSGEAARRFETTGLDLGKTLSALLVDISRDGDAESVRLIGSFQEIVLRVRFDLERYTTALKAGDLEDARKLAAEGSALLKAAADRLKESSHAGEIKDVADRYTAFVATIDDLASAIAARVAASEVVDKLGPEVAKGYGSLLDTVVGRQNTLGPQAQATAESTVTQTVVVSGVFALVGLAIALTLGFGISRAIGAITTSMRRLADGDLTAEIYGANRKDEIGSMAGAVAVFKQNAIERQRLEAEQEAAKVAAEQEKRRVLAAMADEFEAAVGGIVSGVSASASQLKSSAQVMASTSEETSRQSSAVAAASEQASVNVQTVATATEELAVSVAEVGKQVTASARMSDNAVAEAAATAEKVKALSVAADRIGSIVDLIQTISGQTNLLALNATIEAARAGEAGRGFAVVAAEVKNLADQTAKATTEIAQHIAAIQTSTSDSVSAIDGISTLIRNLNQIATAIAGAVEEQGAATQEIARNVQQAAQGTSSVSGAILEVQQAAGDASNASSQVLGAAGGLADQASRLREELNRFLGNVRAG